MGQADRKRTDAIRNGVQAYLDKNPGLSFRSAYHLLMKDRPDLFKDEAGRGPAEQEKLKADVTAKQQAIHDEIDSRRPIRSSPLPRPGARSNPAGEKQEFFVGRFVDFLQSRLDGSR